MLEVKRKYGLIMAVCLVAAGTFAGCRNKSDDNAIVVSASQVTGLWKKNGRADYYRYRADHTGCYYNTDEGFSEDFPSYEISSWEINSGNKLRFVTLEQGVPITRTYTITAISSSSMTREEEVGTYTLTKIE